MVWTHLGAKLAREQMSEAAILEFDPAAIGRLAVDDIMASGMQTSPLPPVRNTEPASGSQPAPPMRGSKKKKKKEASSPKRKKAISEVQAPVPQAVDAPSADETLLIPPNGVPGEVCLGIRVNVEEFKKDISSGDRLHGVKVDWSTIDLSQATNTVSYERKMVARRELFRMRVRMDGRLVETMDPDEMEKSQKGNRPRKRKRRLASEKADGVPSTDNSLPQETPPVRVNPSAPANTSGVATDVTGAMIAAMKSVVERTQKGKEKVSEAPADLEDVRMGKTALSLSRADQYKEPTIGSPTGQTSGRVLEEHKRVRRLHAELEERLAEIEKENLALNNKAHTLEAEKQRMIDRVALMSRPDLYELLEAKLDGFQLANHAGVVGNFENLTLTLTRKWTTIPGLNLDKFEQCPNKTALPDATYEFFCMIFVPQGTDSINPNTGETVTMEEDVEREELVGGRGRHVTRNEVDVVSTSEHKRFVFIEVNMALKLWVAENALRGVSFVKGHRTLECQIDRNGIEEAYSIICESLKNTAQNHPDPIQYYEHMRGIFDSYVNPDGDPDVHPVVMGLDADDFSVDKLLGPQELQAPPARRDIDGADFEDDLSKRERIRLQSDIIAMRDVLPPVTRSARTRLDYDALAGPSYVPPPADVEEVISVGEDISAGAPAEKEAIMDLVLHTGDTPTNAPTGCIADVVNLEEDDGMKSPPPSQIIPVRDTELVDLSEYMDSPEENKSLRRGWPTHSSLTKADIQFLGKPRDELHNMFYVNTFWFTLTSNLVHKYEKSKFSLEKLKPITRLRNSICPDLRDGDLLTGMPAWIFIPVHGKQHWSLAIIRLIGNQCRLCHLESHTGIHETSKIFHVLKTFVAHTLPIDTNQIVEDIFEIDEQRNEYTCGFHVLQMLAGAGKKELALDRCYMVERLQSIAKLDQVTSFEIMMSSYLEGKLKIVPS
ncbi:hypothetical protein R1sor_023070 [Riccia sorocarpa]|uniref:Ubiquitin-like protease family profile domain-containing protein n=1 Tax=Riccia sorocarpa TaxID=122646 RepID=A0ABD3GNV5_9MARC